MSLEFRAIKNQNGKAVFTDLSPEQQGRIPAYMNALAVAQQTNVPNPRFSGYHVKAAASVGNAYVPGGNIEYGFCQVLHGEESVVAAIRSRVDRNGFPIVAMHSDHLEPTCCGNCRDILFDEFGDGEIVTGPSKGVVSVATFDDMKFNGFQKIPRNYHLNKFTIRTFEEGTRLLKDAYSGSQHPERNYFVGIKTHSGFYVGAHDVGCDYHPIYAGRDAMRQARRARDPFVESIFVVSQVKPDIMYKDRQHLLELNIDNEIVSGAEHNPMVCLASMGSDTRMWVAGLNEIMPFPFTVRVFGEEFLRSYETWCRRNYD